jgi:hypothetical protein
MPTLAHQDSFEHGVAVAAGAGLYDGVSASPPTYVTTPTPPDGGTRCIKFNGNPNPQTVARNFAGTPTLLTGQFKIWLPSGLTSGTGNITYMPLGGPDFKIQLVGGTPKLRFVCTSDGSTEVSPVETGTLAFDTWHRIAFRLNLVANPWVFEWELDGTTQTGSSPAIAASAFSFSSWTMGMIDNLGSGTWEWYCKDWVFSHTSGDYPFGNLAGKIYKPNAVGTHNLDAATSLHFFKNDGSETALTTSETTSYQTLDDIPLDSDLQHILIKTTPGAATLPVHQATVSHTGNPTTAPSATLGTTALNDVLIAVVSSGGSTTVPTLAGTYTSTGGGSWTLIDSGVGATSAFAVYWSRCSGNHTGQTVTSTTVDSGSLVVSRYNNVLSTATPIGANKIESATSNAANPGLGAFTSLHANSKIVLAVAADDNLAVVSAAAAGGNALSIRGVPTSSGGADSGAGIMDRDQAAAGTTGAFTTTWGANAASTNKYLLAFELRGAPSETQPTNTWYAEYALEDGATAPVSVRPIARIRNESGTDANDLTIKLRANSNESNVFSGTIGSATDIYKSAILPTAPGGAAWTDGIFDGATLRVGYTADATPAMRIVALAVEAFHTVAGATTYPISFEAALALTPSVNRTVGRTVSSALTLTASVSRQVRRSVTAALTLTPTVSRSISRAVSATLTLVPTALRTLGRSVSVPLTFTVNVTAIKVFIISASVALTLSASVSRQIGRSVSVALTLPVTVRRVIARNVSTALTLTPTVRRVIARSVAVPLTLVPTALRTIERRINVALNFATSVIVDAGGPPPGAVVLKLRRMMGLGG